MDLVDFLIHFSGFAAPALGLAILLPLLASWLLPRRAIVTGFWAQAAIGALTGVAVLAGGLWLFGRDGKMATYGALVVAMTSVQWLMAGAWRR